MKLDLKNLDFQKMFLDHVEKIVLGVFVLALFYLAYSAIGLEPYPKTPEAMAQKASEVQTVVSSADWDEYYKQKANLIVKNDGQTEIADADRPIRIDDYNGEAKDSFTAVPVLPISPLLPPIERPTTKRGEPKYYAVLDLEVAHGFGAFGLQPDAVAAAAPGAEEEDPRRRPMAPARKPRQTPEERRQARIREGGRLFGALADPAMGGRQGFEGQVPTRGARPARGAPRQPEPGEGEGEAAAPQFEGFGDSMKVTGYQWVVVNALVPITKQQLEFFDRLGVTTQNVRPTDYVQYTNFEVQRAEVKSEGSTPQDGDFKSLDLNQLAKEMERWADVEQPEVVNEICLYPGLSSPLPPRLDRLWDRDVVHSQFDAFLLNNEDALKQQEDRLKKGAEKETKGAPANPFLKFNQEMGYGYGFEGTNMPIGMQGGMEGPIGQVGDQQAPEFRLFRFFDFTVEEGKTYVYRVRLELKNPNFGLPAKTLESEGLAAKEFVQTAWSTPSSPKLIPRSINLLVGGLQRDRSGLPIAPNTSRESRISVIVRQWNREFGSMAAKVFTMARGQVANFKAEEVMIVQPGQPAQDFGGAGGQQGAKAQKVDFKTDTLLIDFLGGLKIKTGRDYIEACDALFMDHRGNLVSYSELKDRQAFLDEQYEIDRRSGAGDEPDPNDPFMYEGIDPLSGLPAGRGS